MGLVNTFQRPFPQLMSNASASLSLSEEEFRQVLLDAGWGVAAAESECADRRAYLKSLEPEAPEVVAIDPGDPHVQASLRRRTRKPKRLTTDDEQEPG